MHTCRACPPDMLTSARALWQAVLLSRFWPTHGTFGACAAEYEGRRWANAQCMHDGTEAHLGATDAPPPHTHTHTHPPPHHPIPAYLRTITPLVCTHQLRLIMHPVHALPCCRAFCAACNNDPGNGAGAPAPKLLHDCPGAYACVRAYVCACGRARVQEHVHTLRRARVSCLCAEHTNPAPPPSPAPAPVPCASGASVPDVLHVMH